MNIREKHEGTSVDYDNMIPIKAPFFIPLIPLTPLIPFMLYKRAFAQKIYPYCKKIYSCVMAPIEFFYSKQIDSPTSYAIGGLLAAAAFFTIKFGHKPIL